MPILDNKEAHITRFAGFRGTRDMRTAAFDMVGGGDFELVGFTEARLLDEFAPVGNSGLLVDVGCGPGRLARYLKDRRGLRYLGTDVVPELLEVARSECGRPDWRFEEVSGFHIPLEAGSADVVAFFSVFTNMLPEQSFLLVREAARALRSGGRVVISYLDIDIPRHQNSFLELVEHQAKRIDPLVFLDRSFLEMFAARNELRSLTRVRPEDIALEAAPGARLLDGRELTGKVSFWQAIAVMEKP